MFTHIDIPIFSELTTEIKRGGRWYITPNGDSYASVTTILGAKPKQAIIDWRNALGSKKADKETNRAAARGTAVHDMAEKYLSNIESCTNDHERKNIKLFNQLKYLLNNIDNIRIQEIPLFCDDLKIAGRVDCIGEYDGGLAVIDFKTSTNIKTDKMVLDYKIQCTMYALCYYEMFDVWIDDFAILIAVEKGIMPQVFRGQTKKYVTQAVERINEFYEKIA